MEYAAAKSTMCRQCGRHYAPAAAAPKPAAKLRLKTESSGAPAGDVSVFRKVEGFWGRQRSSLIECFECKAKQEVSSAASSTICPACSAHIDLQDYKITTSFSRTIRTHGEVHITAKGDLSSNMVMCRSALIEGKLRGNLHCSETATIDFAGKIPGRLTASHVLVAEGVVVIHKTGSLDGDVTARAISVEKGGVFFGQLIIGRRELTQGELLPATSAMVEKCAPEVPITVTPPLPATS